MKFQQLLNFAFFFSCALILMGAENKPTKYTPQPSPSCGSGNCPYHGSNGDDDCKDGKCAPPRYKPAPSDNESNSAKPKKNPVPSNRPQTNT